MSSFQGLFLQSGTGAIAMPFDCYSNNYNEIGVVCFGNQWVASQGVNLAIAQGGLISQGKKMCF